MNAAADRLSYYASLVAASEGLVREVDAAAIALLPGAIEKISLLKLLSQCSTALNDRREDEALHSIAITILTELSREYGDPADDGPIINPIDHLFRTEALLSAASCIGSNKGEAEHIVLAAAANLRCLFSQCRIAIARPKFLMQTDSYIETGIPITFYEVQTGAGQLDESIKEQLADIAGRQSVSMPDADEGIVVDCRRIGMADGFGFYRTMELGYVPFAAFRGRVVVKPQVM